MKSVREAIFRYFRIKNIDFNLFPSPSSFTRGRLIWNSGAWGTAYREIIDGIPYYVDRTGKIKVRG